MAQRAAERDYGSEFNVAAGAHLAGPFITWRCGAVPSPSRAPVFVPAPLRPGRRCNGNLYTDVKTVFKDAVSGYIET